MSEDSGSSSMSNPLDEQSGETLVLWGAYAVLAVWVIFEVIMEEYFVTTTTVAVALLLAVVPQFDAGVVKTLSGNLNYSKLGGYLLAAAGVSEIVSDLRNNIFDAGGSTIVGGLIAWVAYFVVFWGARKIEL